MPRKNIFSAQQPAPVLLNDFTGFFAAAMEESRTAGLLSLLPGGSVIQSDTAAKQRLLQAQIAWTPANARWNGCKVTVSLSDAQFALVLESGGDSQQGRLTILADKLQFSSFGKGLPTYGEVFRIQAGGVWHDFTVAEVVGQYDDNEPGLTLFLDKEQNDVGD